MKFRIELCTPTPGGTKGEHTLRVLATAGKLEEACMIARTFDEHYRGQRVQIWVRLRARKADHQFLGHCCDSNTYQRDWLAEGRRAYDKLKAEGRLAKARYDWLKQNGGFDLHWQRIQGDEKLRAAFFANRFEQLQGLLGQEVAA